MYLRIIRGQTRPGQVAEILRRWQVFIGDRFRTEPGFRRAYFGGSTEVDAVVMVSHWDTPPDADLFNNAVHTFTDQERALLRGRLTIEDYQILGEVAG